MPPTAQIKWQPLSKIPLIASMIDGALADTREHLESLTEARYQPHALDDATIDRSERVHIEQMEFGDIYEQQIRRWRTEKPSAAQIAELDRLEKQNRELRAATADVLALAAELRKESIDRFLGMSDVENRPPDTSQFPVRTPPLTTPTTLRTIRYRTRSFIRDYLSWQKIDRMPIE